MRTTWRLSALAVSLVMLLAGSPPLAQADSVGSTESAPPTPSARSAGIAVADRLLALQDHAGAIADTPGGSTVNEDSNLAYALWGLAAGYRATGERRYLQGLRRGVRWLADRLVMDPGRWRGSYWYGYQSRPPYAHRRISPGGPVADARGVDASSALFVYDLWLYTRLSGSRKLARKLRVRALAAVDFVLDRNRASDGFFYSSWQRQRGSDKWRLWRYQYSADQGDVRLGMGAAARLYGMKRHKRAARFLGRVTSSEFFLAGQRRFALGRDAGGEDTSMEGFNGVFPQGYLPWVLRADSRTAAASGWLAGCVDTAGAPRCGPGGVAYSLAASVLALGARRTGQVPAGSPLAWLLATTFDPPTGAVGDSDRHPRAEYSNVDGFTALALLGAPPHAFGW